MVLDSSNCSGVVLCATTKNVTEPSCPPIMSLIRERKGYKVVKKKGFYPIFVSQNILKKGPKVVKMFGSNN